RSVRQMQDFNPAEGLNAKTGIIAFRGRGGALAGDSQCAYILMAYREHLMSADHTFLQDNWPNIRKSLKFSIHQDKNSDGLIEGRQHNTYDISFYGANTMIGSLYLAALRAGEEMALKMRDDEFAQTCRNIFESGRILTVDKLFDGEYFIQKVDRQKYPKFQYNDGCLSDHLIGQGWAHQVGLGYIYPREYVLKALRSVWKYNWAPDVGPHTRVHQPEIVFADPGEPGLLLCTWPKSKHPGYQSVRYRNTVWTGIEAQVAGHMLYEGMLKEGLAIVRGIHDRYDGTKHNPWNQILCGDHYARAMASWGCLIGVSGFIYDGPAGKIGFAPRLNPQNFKAFFSAAEGWGSIVQQRTENKQTNRIEVKWGKLRVKTMLFELPEGLRPATATITAADRKIEGKSIIKDNRIVIELAEPVIVNNGSAIEVVLSEKR
ncbi:MAG: GH116 family glycosyl hydrolase, partial [Planctomycetota bacterium]